MTTIAKIKGTNIPDMTGKVFGRLTVLEHVLSTPEHKRQAFWKYVCKCGKIKIASGKNLRQGTVQSCGCFQSERTKDTRKKEALARYGISSKNRALAVYKRNASLRNHIFNLSNDEFFEITQKECFYCNKNPSNISKTTNGNFIYNGLDRIDSNIGYELSNVVACCRTCNIAKHTMSLDEFKEWITNVFNNIIK